MTLRQASLLLAYAVALAALAGTLFATRGYWVPLLPSHKASAEKKEGHEEHAHGDRVKLTPQARQNLGLVVKPVALTDVYWRTMEVPGAIVDRPGQSDRGVPAPITG